MPPRGFTNPAPKTESARSALSSFTCNLCNKSYSRHPEYEAHIGSYDHQHRKRLQDLKQLSRDPNAAEKARRAERKADAEAGLRVIDAPIASTSSSGTTGGGGGFKKGGFKSSFAAVKGSAAPVLKNVLGNDDEDEAQPTHKNGQGSAASKSLTNDIQDAESDTDEEYGRDKQGYYNPRHPTDCLPGCAGLR
ncbi:hypothetical protein N7520_002549 [Penicillium odoratum]|uniref:uncharacterized protein n=1 Tax=Penicillium odoratum TaxID=1167516 RepID=UPI002547B663|nr:uncharacterized protein N7520_002549 [Penicillium odoratum]KAJ5772020.1 hypothetical protein N7520_002549 [Penicillium odoratum]